MSQVHHEPSPGLPRGRIDLVDLARGLALLAMFVFHFSYDLSFFGLIETDVTADPGWRWFARSIAGSFLTLVGISLVLATRNGLRRQAYLKRLAMVTGAAALVTIATWFAMRDNFIFFGILHHVALASVLGLAFVRLPAWLLALTAALAFALPQYLAHPLLDESWLAWLGLSHLPVRSADYVPLFPWFGCVLTGMALAKLAPNPDRAESPLAWRARTLPARIVSWGGRHSLMVYLVHQPVFIGVIWLATRLAVLPAQDERPFLVSCQRSCVGTGTELSVCQKVCACTVGRLKRDDLWRKIVTDSLSNEESARTGVIAQACYREP